MSKRRRRQEDPEDHDYLPAPGEPGSTEETEDESHPILDAIKAVVPGHGDDVQRQLDEIRAMLEEVQGQLGTKANAASLGSARSSLEEQIQTIQDSLSSLQRQVRQLHSRMTDAAEMTASIGIIQSKVESLEERLSIYEPWIRSILAEYGNRLENRIDSRLAAIERELSEHQELPASQENLDEEQTPRVEEIEVPFRTVEETSELSLERKLVLDDIFGTSPEHIIQENTDTFKYAGPRRWLKVVPPMTTLEVEGQLNKPGSRVSFTSATLRFVE